MLFSTIFFVFMFLPAVLLLYYLLPQKAKNVFLIIVSLIFYAWGNPYYVLLLVGLITVTYFTGLWIGRQEGKKRLYALIEAIICNVFLLVYFKYYGSFLKTIFFLLPSVSYQVFDMPLGISFIIFQILSYLIDVYRGKVAAEKNFLHLSLFISFFPKLLMGPIDRYPNFGMQIQSHPQTLVKFGRGCDRFLIGLAQKVLIADTLAAVWSSVSASTPSMLGSWLGILAYTLEIYFDFAGYSSMAVGMGQMFGFTLMENFRYPYIAKSLTDFWRRWHITLSSWFKEYIYISLGGNRTSTFLQHLVNLLIVWGLTGFWHGSSLNFIVWGFYHGILLIVEKYIFPEQLNKLSPFTRWAMTMFLVIISWVFFASEDLTQAFVYLGHMVGIGVNGIWNTDFFTILHNYGVYYLIAILWCTPFFHQLGRLITKSFGKDTIWLKGLASFVLWILIIIYMVSSTYQSFLYFQF